MKKVLVIIALFILLAGVIYLATQVNPPITHTIQLSLSVRPLPDFGLSSFPQTISSPIGRTVGYEVTATSINNFAGEVVFSVSGLPAGFTTTFFPSNTMTVAAGGTGTVQVNVDIGNDPALIGDYTITVTAESTVYN